MRFHIALASALGVVLFCSTAVGIGWLRLQGNVNIADVDTLIGTRPSSAASPPPFDPKAGTPINLLLIGSDVRSGEFADKSIAGMRSDATMVVHISADRKRIDAVSIPRDLRINTPSCQLRDGKTTRAGTNRKFNEAFALGGSRGDVGEAAACTIKTVEALTGVYIDDYIVVDFQGFEAMVDAVGGVPLHFPKDVNDRRADLYVKSGCRLLDGETALAAARSRYAQGDGSDIGRIGRQQKLVSALIREVLNLNLLTNLPSLYSFLDATTKSLTTGPKIGSLSTMAGLAYSIRSIDPASVNFLTAPFDWRDHEIYPSKDFAMIWKNMAADRPLTEDPNAPAADAKPSPSDKTPAKPTDGKSEPSKAPSPAPGGATPSPAKTLKHGTTAEQSDEQPACTKANAEPNE